MRRAVPREQHMTPFARKLVIARECATEMVGSFEKIASNLALASLVKYEANYAKAEKFQRLSISSCSVSPSDLTPYFKF